MSTQDAAEIPFSAAHARQAFKLLELPPDLLALLESDNPPALFIKSSIPTSTGTTHAILTTPSKTYRIQQKNTSNPIMILHPSDTRFTELQIDQSPAQQGIAAIDMDVDGVVGHTEFGELIPRPSVCTISTIEDTLELIEQDDAAVVKPVKVNKWHEKFAKSRTAEK